MGSQKSSYERPGSAAECMGLVPHDRKACAVCSRILILVERSTGGGQVGTIVRPIPRPQGNTWAIGMSAWVVLKQSFAASVDRGSMSELSVFEVVLTGEAAGDAHTLAADFIDRGLLLSPLTTDQLAQRSAGDLAVGGAVGFVVNAAYDVVSTLVRRWLNTRGHPATSVAIASPPGTSASEAGERTESATNAAGVIDGSGTTSGGN
jgi:hypothetical protein